MAKKNEFKLRLNIHGYGCSTSEITRIVGISPTETWRAGEPVVPGALNRHEENGWRISSPLPVNHSLAEHWVALRDKMQILASRRDRLPPEVIVEVSCIIYVYENTPSIFFEKDQIDLMGRLGAELDIDLYNLTE